MEWVWPTHLLPPGSARTGYAFQLPVVHSFQSNKGCVLQGVVQSTALGHSTSIITLAASRRDNQKIKPTLMAMATQTKLLGIRNWRRNSLLGEFPSHHLLPGKHWEQTGKADGAGSWHLRRNRESTGAANVSLLEDCTGNTHPCCIWGEILQRSVSLCWRMAVVA